MTDDKRTARCIKCEQEWNISKWARIPKKGYTCPRCNKFKKLRKKERKNARKISTSPTKRKDVII